MQHYAENGLFAEASVLILKPDPALDPAIRLGKDSTIDIRSVREVVHCTKEVEIAVSVREREFDLEEIVKDKDLIPSFGVAGIVIDVFSNNGMCHPFMCVRGRDIVQGPGVIFDHVVGFFVSNIHITPAE